MVYTYRQGLARVDSSSPWHYLFQWKGVTYQGTTGLLRRADAEAWLRRYREQLTNAEVGLATPPTVELAYKAWLTRRTGKVSPGHLKRVKQAMRLHILPALGHLQADKVTTDLVEQMLTTYLTGESDRTPRKTYDEDDKLVLVKSARTQFGADLLLRTLRMILLTLVRDGILKRIPYSVPMLRPQEPVRAWVSEGMIPMFLSAVDRTGNLHQQVAIRSMLYMGLRESEALGMRWAWIHGDLETYTPGRTKGKERPRPLPIHSSLRELIRRLPSTSVFLLPAEDGHPHRSQYTVKAVQRGGRACGIVGLSPHRLRNTAATLMARAGVPVTTIQQQLRHAKIETTQKYVQVGLEDLQDAMKKTWGTL